MARSHTHSTPFHIFVQLPLMATVAIYAHHATRSQQQEAVPYSQVDDLTQFAFSLGYTKEQVTVFLEAETAATPLEKCASYQALLQAIRAGSVSVVFLSDIACLFAGVDEKQLNIFMHLCMEKGIFVVTPQMVYDFSNLTLAHQFRVNCTKACEALATLLTHATGNHQKHGNT